MASQTITGPLLQFTQDNERCFAYSGEITYSQTETTALLFPTDSNYILASFGFSFAVDSSDDAFVAIYFNDIEVLKHLAERGTNRVDWPYTDVQLIIPPFTSVKTTVKNLADASRVGFYSYLTGRAYQNLTVRN